jgi:hypothetical protein
MCYAFYTEQTIYNYNFFRQIAEIQGLWLFAAVSLQHPAFWDMTECGKASICRQQGRKEDKSVQWHRLKSQKTRMFELPWFEYQERCTTICIPPIILTITSIIISLHFMQYMSGFDFSCQALCLADTFEYRAL